MNGESDFAVKWQDALPVPFILVKVVFGNESHRTFSAFRIQEPTPSFLGALPGQVLEAVQMWLKETNMYIVIWPLKWPDTF